MDELFDEADGPVNEVTCANAAATSLQVVADEYYAGKWARAPWLKRRAEYVRTGLAWASSGLTGRRFESRLAKIAVDCVGSAIYAGLSDHVGYLLSDWADAAAGHMANLIDYRDGKRPPCAEVLASIVWMESGGRTRESHVKQYAAMSYDEYLLTPYWKCLREIVLERDGRECRTCRATSRLQVHHRTYEHRGCEHEHLDDLLTLCAGCHGRIHDKI